MRLLLVLIIGCTVQVSLAQEGDSISRVSDSTFIDKRGRVVSISSYANRFNPRKALLYSAIFPGMGQAYNRKYWKVPLVYGGFAALVGVAKFYHNQNAEYRADLFQFLSETPKPQKSKLGLTEEQLRSIIDRSRRERDYFIILSTFWYILQMVDAHVDAHLKEFDVNPNLKVSLKPTLEQSMITGRTSGFSVTLKF